MGDTGRPQRPGGAEFDENLLRELIVRHLQGRRPPSRIRIVTDTTNFLGVDRDDVLIAGGRPYLIRNNEREGRFGLDDEPKFWVKRSIDLLSGETKIIKLGFQEEYKTRVGPLVVECVRSPRKEARLLELVQGDERFMQGFAASDGAGNLVRVIDFIKGKTLADTVFDVTVGHEEYFATLFPPLLLSFIELVEAIAFLHLHGEKHGDIRRDHVIIDRTTGKGRWIDFDFNYFYAPNPSLYDLSGLGNVLAFLAAKGELTLQELSREGHAAVEQLGGGDMNIIFRNRVMNIRKVYPYVPLGLNSILMHFAEGAQDYYEDVGELLDDLREAAAVFDTPGHRGALGMEGGVRI